MGYHREILPVPAESMIRKSQDFTLCLLLFSSSEFDLSEPTDTLVTWVAVAANAVSVN